jgi:DNA-binding NarL/FixJ family response regulator
MVNEGFSDKEIAFRVGLAVGSVKRLNHEMYERIGVTGRVAFGKWYRENISASAAVLLADNNMRMGAFE